MSEYFVFDPHGNRFANELGEVKSSRLALNKAASSEIGCHCKQYTEWRVMKFHVSGAGILLTAGECMS